MASVECLIGETSGWFVRKLQVAGGDRSLPSQPISAGGHQQEGDSAMAYGLSTRAFIEDGPVEQVAKAEAKRTTARSWHALSEASRLAVIEQALRAANDRIDAYPFAL
jgi:hypothetical protein